MHELSDERIRQFAEHFGFDWQNGYSIYDDDDVPNSYLSFARAVLAEAMRGREWIACSERMPDTPTATVVLAYGPGFGREVIAYSRRVGWLMPNDIRDEPVTHWQPLPLPPAAAPKGDAC